MKDKYVIFLDTSIFESENFFLGRNLNNLVELSRSGQIELKITDIVYREIIQRIKENINKANIAFKKAQSLITGEGKILKNIYIVEIPKIDIEATCKIMIEKLELYLANNNIEIVDTVLSNSQEIFEDYFNLKPPFYEGKKKYEFPDAFTFNTIKQWTKVNNTKVYFISNDSDFAELSSEEIDCKQNLSTIIDLISREIDNKHTTFIESIYNNSELQIIYSLDTEFTSELEDAVYNYLENEPFYEDVEVETAKDINTEIVTGVINEVNLNSSFSYEIESNIFFTVEVEYTDLSTGHYDKEDGVWWGEERRTEIKEFSANVVSIADFSYDLKNNKGFYIRMGGFTIRDLEEK